MSSFSSRVNCFVYDLFISTIAELHPILTSDSDPSPGPCWLLLVLHLQEKQKERRADGTERDWRSQANLAGLKWQMQLEGEELDT